MKLIVNTISSEQITKSKQITKGWWTFTTEYIDRNDYGPKYSFLNWDSKPVKDPTEGDMAQQAQKFLTETGDYHPYLEGYRVNDASHEIYMEFGS